MVDLKTGVLAAHDRSRMCTKCTSVEADFSKPAPQWQAFLNEACNGDAEMISYLQRLAGYSATGSTKEHVLAFAHGSGGNGKGTFLGAVGNILGDYATVASADVFLASNNQRHPTELASLMGARLVHAQEIDPSRKWDEAKVKALKKELEERLEKDDYRAYGNPKRKDEVSLKNLTRSLEQAYKSYTDEYGYTLGTAELADLTDEEKEKYPMPNKKGEYYEWRMDMTTLQMFPERDFIEALVYIDVLPEDENDQHSDNSL